MIPILFEKDETSFTSNGLGGLPDAVSCTVTRESVFYELTMKYPMKGLHFDLIAYDRIILAKPDAVKSPQPFRIYNISRPIGGVVTICAEHISYQTNHIPVMPFFNRTPAGALQKIKESTVTDCPFNLLTDISSEISFSPSVPKSMRQMLIGDEESFISIYGGEIDFDMYDISIKLSQGADNGVKIAYGKNLVDLKQEENISNTITGICPYATHRDGETETTLTLPTGAECVLTAHNFSYPRILTVDLSSEMTEEDWAGDIATQQNALKNHAENYIKTHKIGVPEISITVDFINLGDSEEYAHLKNLSRLRIYDWVSVEFTALGVNSKAQVSKTEYDVLREKYNKITLGELKKTVSDTIVAQSIEQAQTVDTSRLTAELKRQAEMITGNNGGYVILYPRYNPSELLIMDTDDINTATNVWRFNKAGLCHGTSYDMISPNAAITMDGHISGEHLTAGSVDASAIKADSITSREIKAGAITTDELATNAVAADKIKAGAITTDKIKAGAITADKLSAGAITADKIDTGELKVKKLLSAGETVNLTLADEGGLIVTGVADSQMQLLGWGALAALKMPKAKGFAIELENLTLLTGNESVILFGTSLSVSHGIDINANEGKFNITSADFGTVIVTPKQATVSDQVINYLGWEYPSA